MTATGLEPRTTLFVNEHSTIWTNWPNEWAVFWVLICTVDLTACPCHVTYALQSESTLYNCFEQGVPWHSDNYRVWIDSETRTWHDKNMQSISFLLELIYYVLSISEYILATLVAFDFDQKLTQSVAQRTMQCNLSKDFLNLHLDWSSAFSFRIWYGKPKMAVYSPLRRSSFVRGTWKVYRSGWIPRKLPIPEKFLVARLYRWTLSVLLASSFKSKADLARIWKVFCQVGYTSVIEKLNISVLHRT